MTRDYRPDEIDGLLQEGPAAPPPPGLRERIMADIPPVLAPPVAAGPRRAGGRGFQFLFGASRIGLAGSLALHAAGLVLALSAGWWLRGTALEEPRLVPVDDVAVPDVGLHGAGRHLRAGWLPPRGSVRVADVLAGLRFDDAPPAGTVVALYAEGAPTPFTPGADHRLIRFGVAAGLAVERADAQIEFGPAVAPDPRAVADLLPRSSALRPGDTASALYEVRLQPAAPREVIARLLLEYRGAAGGAPARAVRELQVADLAPDWDAASPSLRLAVLAAEFAELLGAGEADPAALDALSARAQRLVGELPGRADVADFVMLTAVAVHARPGPRTPDATIFAGPQQTPVIVLAEATEPVLVARVDPEYPEHARARGLAGTVVLRLGVDARGAIDEVAIVESVPGLDESAVAAVRQWKYRPAVVEGRAVPAEVTVSLRFVPR